MIGLYIIIETQPGRLKPGIPLNPGVVEIQGQRPVTRTCATVSIPFYRWTTIYLCQYIHMAG